MKWASLPESVIYNRILAPFGGKGAVMQVIEEAVKALVARVHAIVSHLEMHHDEFMARWFLRTFGEKLFPGIRKAILILVDSGIRLLREKSGAEWFTLGYPCLGTCGGPLDEHDLPPEERKNASAATLAAQMLKIERYPPVQAMIAHAVRVDRTATASGFDISAIIKAMHRNGVPIAQMCRMYDRMADAWFTVLSSKVRNAAWKEWPTFDQLTAEWIVARMAPEGYDTSKKKFKTAFEAADDTKVLGIRALRPLLDYFIEEEKRSVAGAPAKDRLFEMNGIVDALNQDGASKKDIREIVFTALESKWTEQLQFCEGFDELKALKKRGKLYTKGSKWTIIRVVSDNPEINKAARHLDPHCDIFVQRNTDGHMVIWYNKKLNMDEAITRLRMGDRDAHRMPRLSQDILKAEGTLPEAPWWYYNPANGQIMCGSRTNRGTPVTRLDDNAVLRCIVYGLEAAEKSKAS